MKSDRAQFRRSYAGWLIALIGTLVLGAVYTWRSISVENQAMRAHYLRQACLTADSLDPEQIKMLSGTDADLLSPIYMRLKRKLMAVREYMPNIRFLYLMGIKEDSSVFFLIDSEPMGSTDESPPGQIYDEISAEALNVFYSRRPVIEGPIADRWGTWVSALVPIVDHKTGDLIAVFGMDVDADLWKRTVVLAGIFPAALSLALWLLLFFYYVYDRRRGLTDPRSQGSKYGYSDYCFAAAMALVLTITLAWEAHQQENRRYSDAFWSTVTPEAHWIMNRLQDLRNFKLYGLAGIFKDIESLSLEQFIEYTDLFSMDPIVDILVWAPLVNAQDKNQFEAWARRTSGTQDFTIWENDEDDRPVRASPREYYYPLLYLNPSEGHEGAIGFDLASDTVRLQTIKEAMSAGLPTVTEPLALIHMPDDAQRLLVIQPVFAAHHRERPRGFLVAVLDVAAMFRKFAPFMVHIQQSFMDFELYHADFGGPLNLLAFTADTPPTPALDPVSRVRDEYGLFKPIFLFGKVFYLRGLSNAEFRRVYPRYAAWVAAIIALLLTSTAAFLVLFFKKRHEKLETRDLFQTEFHRVTADISAALIKVKDLEFDSVLEQSLGKLGALFDVDRVYVFRIFDDPLRATNTHEWCAEAVAPQKDRLQNLPATEMQWWARQLFDFQPIIIHDLEDMPPEAASEKQILASQGIQSLLCVPLVDAQPSVVGFMGFDAVRSKKTWNKNDIDLLGVVVDIISSALHRREARLALSESRAWFRSLVASMSGVILRRAADSHLTELYVSGYVGYMTGYSASEFGLGGARAWSSLIHSDDLPRLNSILRDAVESDFPFEVEYRIRHADGRNIWIYEKGQRRRDEIQGAFLDSIALDVSSRKAVEEEVIRALRIKDEFISMVSHELRTPITVIMGGVNLVEDESCGPLNEQQKSMLSIAKRNVNRLGRLINSVLNIQKLESGAMYFDMAPINIAILIQEAVQALEPEASQKGLKIDFKIPSRLPTVLADADKITQVLINLIHNAINFADEGKILVAAKVKGRNVIVSISDTGMGIDPNLIPNLFKKFIQASTGNKRKTGGTGLGLAICKEIIARHKGEIWVESVLSKGSTFYFSLPIEGVET